jgi:putative FmdB family regulatory protein
MSGGHGYTRWAMPIYEYRCTKGHNFDAIQRMSDDSLTKCEVCGAPVQRVLHAPAVHFKGSGFYNTDYGTKKRSREKESHEKSKAKDTSSSSTSDSSASTSGSSDTKPASSDSGSSSSDSGAKKKPEPAKASSSSSS